MTSRPIEILNSRYSELEYRSRSLNVCVVTKIRTAVYSLSLSLSRSISKVEQKGRRMLKLKFTKKNKLYLDVAIIKKKRKKERKKERKRKKGKKAIDENGVGGKWQRCGQLYRFYSPVGCRSLATRLKPITSLFRPLFAPI